ncbi:DEAD/DEAH box helicase family protein [Mycoplasma sp. 1654_15]|uniref:DEAD/DEAH box helicase family protein n=1 Tax=Mycoplasma sp. 1654_15 TaxID=2725994 RepID=UPI0014492366|nr:DEAD/DEAH box helicase family protein [Mycoplasma sp. 1654_15]QJB71414.1 DEAD/DEAH box helicase family protein [Mycoplasma sp. 1654_15]
MELSEKQAQAVDLLVYKWKKAFDNQQKTSITFKAPTGSGKTFIIANFIDRVMEEFDKNSGKKLVFIYNTISNAELPKQTLNKFEDYKFHLNSMKNATIKYKESPSKQKEAKGDQEYNILAKEADIFIFGTSSFGKSTIFVKEGKLDAFIDELRFDYYVVYIRDEAHIGTSKISEKPDAKSFDKKIKELDNVFELMMTATPKENDDIVEITNKDLDEDNWKLLKANKNINLNISYESTDEIDNSFLLEQACKTFVDIKKQYKQISEDEKLKNLWKVNPAMLIQVKDKMLEKEAEFNKEIKQIIKILEKYNLSYAKYFSEEKTKTVAGNTSKTDLNSLSKKDSDVDVIIFKVGPATGWDIPRACMLVQLRNVSSETLDKQTLGRIKRFPIPIKIENEDHRKELSNSIANEFFVYSNNKKFDQNLRERIYYLKEQYKNKKFLVGEIDKASIIKINQTYKEEVYELISKEFEQICEKFEKFRKKNQDFLKITRKSNINEGRFIEKTIFDQIELEIFNESLIEKYKKLITKDMWKEIESIYNQKINENIRVSIQYYKHYILTDLLEDIKQLNVENWENTNPTLNIKQIIAPPEEYVEDYEIIDINDSKDSSKNYIEIKSEIEKYAYSNNKKLGKNEVKVSVDSEPERKFVRFFTNWLEDDADDNLEINIWFRNFANNSKSIFWDYFEQTQVKKSYPDFIVCINQHQINIEIKGKGNKDISPEKTKDLIQMTQKYVKKANENSLNNKQKNNLNFTSLICWPKNESDDNFLCKGASTLEKINHLFKPQSLLVTERKDAQEYKIEEIGLKKIFRKLAN